MKKIVAVSSVIAMMLGAMANVNAASQNKITVTDGNLRTVSFVNDTDEASSASIKNVLHSLGTLSAKYKNATQDFEVTSEVEEDGAVDVFLRLSNESASSTAYNDSVNLLTFYDIIITDSDGETVFSSKESKPEVVKVDNNEYAADIFLERFNEDDIVDSNTYTISVSVPGECTVSEIKKAMDISWEIVSDPVEEGATPIPVKEAPIVTEKPAATEVPTVTEAPAVTVAPTVTEAPVVTEAPAATEEVQETPDPTIVKGERLIGYGETGTYIYPGKYTASNKVGSTKISIYDEDGELVREVLLDEKDRSKEITLKEGQKLVYEGSKVELVPVEDEKDTKSGTKAATNSKNSKSGNNTSSKSSKTNPKTGDGIPFAGMAMVGVFSLGMLAYPEIEKRRKNNN